MRQLQHYDLWRHVQKLVERSGRTHSDLARAVGVSRQAVHQALTLGTVKTSKVLVLIAGELGQQWEPLTVYRLRSKAPRKREES